MPRIRSITTIAELSAGMMAAFNAINEHYNGELKSPLSPLRKARRRKGLRLDQNPLTVGTG